VILVIRMKKAMISLRLIILVVMAMLVVIGCTNDYSTDGNSDSGGLNTVRIVDFTFEPVTLTVTAGTTVVWINEDAAPHKIKSSTFNSQNMKKADSFSQTFSEPGVYEYICGIHPSMAGKIIVEPKIVE